MKLIWYIIPVIVFVLFSCNEENVKSNDANKTQSYEAKGYIVPRDCVSTPKVTVVDQSKLKRKAVGNAAVLPTNTNVHIAGQPMVTKCEAPVVRVPGSGNFALPKVVPAKDSAFPVKQPKPSMSLAARMKDGATSNIQYLDVDQGMNSSYILCALQDKSGNLWFGTNGGGVSKFDGRFFTHYTDKEGLSNNSVSSILEDRNGNLWFGTDGNGVTKYDGKSFTQYTPAQGFADHTVWAMLEDMVNGDIWFATYRGGVCKYDGKNFTQYTDKEGLHYNSIRCIAQDKKGNLWFGADDNGVSKFDGKSFTHYSTKEGLSNNTVWSILEDKSGNMWFGTDGGGVDKFDGKSFSHYTTQQGLANNVVKSIYEDRKGNLWFGTNGGGVSLYNGNTVPSDQASFVTYSETEGLSNNAVLTIIEDQDGNIWFGTNGGGVSKYGSKSFTYYTEKEGLNNSSIRSITEDKNGNLWFGTSGAGLCKYNGTTITNYTEKEGLANNIVFCSLEDRKGNLWFGTNGEGASKYDGSSFTNYFPGMTIWTMYEDKKGNIWASNLGGGVVKYDGEAVTFYVNGKGLISNTVYSILEDKKGNMWFGTDIGLTKFDGKDFTWYTDKDGLSNNTVMSMLEDKKGNLWFGTYGGGVTKYDGKYFTHYTEKEGVSNNIIWSIAEDKNGNLWFGTENGISCFVWDGTTVDPEILVFHKQDGLKAEDFLSNSILLDSKNQLWMGGGRALTMLDLNKFSLNKNEPVVQLNNVMLQENFVDFQDLNSASKDSSDTKKRFKKVKFTDIAKFHNYPTDLVLPYDASHLTFNFSAIDWSAPHKIKYQYQLQGLDPDWSKLTAENKADYRTIPYGSYVFTIKAIGDANKWSKTFEYSFTILPPWWHTWWFRILMAVVLGLFVYQIFRWRTASLRKKQKELEHQIDLATEDIKQQKHEIEEKHKEITDSINYAERIQRTFLATENVLNKNLNDYFVFFKPKDVVSGDFYWGEKLSNGNFALLTADSTGHGVPGAIMSLLNITSIEAAIKDGHTQPSDILNETRKTIIARLKRDGSSEGGKDGMDCILTVYDFANKKLIIAAANNPVWIVRGQEVIEIKPDKMPVGKHDKDQIPFTQQEIDLQKGDVIYTLTDGFPDQFGGVNGKKFMSKNLRQFLANNAQLPMAEQRELLETTFINWMGNLEQIDDVAVIGVRV